MSEIDTVDYHGLLEYKAFDQNIPKGDFARFVVVFINNVLKTFEVENEVFPSKKPGRKAYSLRKMLSLVYYAYSRGFTKASVIEDLAKNHSYFKFVANGIKPDEDTINNFINTWGCFFDYLISYQTQFVETAGLTNFNNVSSDGTFVKSSNNKFNVVRKEDVKVLIDYYSGKLTDIKHLENLKLSARRILNREDKTNRQKLEYLNDIMKRFDETGANTIPVNDMESIHMINKEGIPDVGFNLQSTVDSESKIFLALEVTQKATDHYELPEIMDKSLKNMGKKPEYCCADAGYHTRRTLEYLDERGLNGLIDNNRSAKLRNGHKNSNKYHKDNMDYNAFEDYFECCNHEKLIYQGTKIKWDDNKEDFKIEREYYDKNACSNCKNAEECCNGKYRIVKINGGILAVKMLRKFEDPNLVREYVKRFSTVEAPNGTMRRFYHINEIQTTGLIKIQNRINIVGGSYNLIRIYNLLMEMEGVDESNILEVTRKFCEYNNPRMFIWQNTTLPCFDKLLQLPYICKSCMPDELNLESDDDYQSVLV